MGETKIEWSDAVWNPVRGCSRVSPGCGGPHREGGCYAEVIASRFSGKGQPFEGFAKRGKGWTGEVALVLEKLTEPLSWREPRLVFVNSMSDLFHDSLSDMEIDEVFGVMHAAEAAGHTFQILTKRAKRMRDYMAQDRRDQWSERAAFYSKYPSVVYDRVRRRETPHPRIWLGVSVEDQQRADERIPFLLETPAAVRFLSCEPLLGHVKLNRLFDEHGRRLIGARPGIGWVIVGGESGSRSRECKVADIRSIVQQCRAAGVPCFVKQLGANVVDRNDAGFNGETPTSWDEEILRIEHLDTGYQGAPVRVHLRHKKGGDPHEWPEDLQVREWPEVHQ